MNAVVETRAPAVLPSVQSFQAPDVQAIVSAIERASMNPRINLDKMDRLLQMQERILTQFREAQFNVSLAQAEAVMGRIPTNAYNEHTKSRYADYAAIDRKIRPIYTAHGFGLSFDEGDAPREKPDHVRVLCLVTHMGGFSRLYHRDMPADGKGAKGGDVMTKTHAVGSAFTYGQRYLVKGIFNLAISLGPEDIDDDGNGAGGIGLEDDAARVKAGYISNKEVADLRAIMSRVNADGPAFLSWLGVERLADVPKIQLKTAIRKLESKGKANTQAPRSTGGNGHCNEKQAAAVRKELDASGIPEKYFFDKFAVPTIEELPFVKVDEALNWIKTAVS